MHTPELAPHPGAEEDAHMRKDASENNRQAVADYERTARAYVATVDGRPSASVDALRQLAARVAPGKRILEIGSGPGWDADALEALVTRSGGKSAQPVMVVHVGCGHPHGGPV